MVHTAIIAFAAGAVLAGVAVALMSASARRGPRAQRPSSPPNADAEHARDVGALTAGLAHEIRNPLSTIGLNARLLREGVDDLPNDRPADDADRAALVRRVDGLAREAERLADILSEFLEYAGELHLEPVDTDLNTLAEELWDFFLPQAEQAGVRLRVEPAPAPARARLDAPHVKQAVLNLLLNAVQAMSGPAQPEARRPELIVRVVRIAGRPADRVALHVIDTGPGIPADARERIFEPYFTTRHGGTGLGLPTARRVIEALGGTLELHTDPDKGTDFALIFPAAD